MWLHDYGRDFKLSDYQKQLIALIMRFTDDIIVSVAKTPLEGWKKIFEYSLRPNLLVVGDQQDKELVEFLNNQDLSIYSHILYDFLKTTNLELIKQGINNVLFYPDKAKIYNPYNHTNVLVPVSFVSTYMFHAYRLKSVWTPEPRKYISQGMTTVYDLLPSHYLHDLNGQNRIRDSEFCYDNNIVRIERHRFAGDILAIGNKKANGQPLFLPMDE